MRTPPGEVIAPPPERDEGATTDTPDEGWTVERRGDGDGEGEVRIGVGVGDVVTRSRIGRMHTYAKFLPKVELHAHLNGCIRESTLVELARERKITLSSRIHEASSGAAAEAGKGGDVRPDDHSGATKSGRDARLSRVRTRLGVSEGRSGDGGGTRNTNRRSLSDCFHMFDEIRTCVDDLSALRRIAWEALEDFAYENVAYAEVRSTPKRLLKGDRFDSATTDGPDRTNVSNLCTKEEYVETILDVMSEFEKEERERYERERADVSKKVGTYCRLPLVPRFLVSVDRSSSVREAEENVSLARGFVEAGCPFVVGVELGGNPTENDFRDFEPALGRARSAGLKVSVHCGEVPSGQGRRSEDDDEENPTLRRAYEEALAIVRFRPDRIGHALLLPPPAIDSLLRNPIPVECCPTSNVMTLELATHHEGDLVEGLRRHPQLSVWLSSGYPLSVCTDDSGVFNTNSTREVLLLAKAFGLDEAAIGRIVIRSLDDIFEPSEGVREELKESVRRRAEKLSAALGVPDN